MIAYHWICIAWFTVWALFWSKDGWSNFIVKLGFAGMALIGLYLRLQ